MSANLGHQREMAQRNGRRKDRVAKALYASACQAKMALQQQEIKVLEVEKVLTKLKQDTRALTHRIETLHTDHHVLVEAIRKEEQDLQVETWLRDEELKLLTLLSQRHGHAHHVREHGLIHLQVSFDTHTHICIYIYYIYIPIHYSICTNVISKLDMYTHRHHDILYCSLACAHTYIRYIHTYVGMYVDA